MNIVPLLEILVEEILKAEDIFLKNPNDFHSLEVSVKSSTESFAASFLGAVLTSLDELIKNSDWRNNKYVVQRQDTRTLISSVGDISFKSTYYKGIEEKEGFKHLVEDLIGLNRNERFTEAAEVALLSEAIKTSYNEATKVLPSKQKITKTTVMNKVHGISQEIPDTIYTERRSIPYLFIEADEDHVAEQYGRNENGVANKSFLSKLIYIYEYKQESPIQGRYELVNKYYFGGIYSGIEGNRELWNKVYRFICNNYDYKAIKKIFISGDGAYWIKSGVNYIDKAIFCADKFHLMKYINAAVGHLCMFNCIIKHLEV